MSAASKLAKMLVPAEWRRDEWINYAEIMRKRHQQHADEWQAVVAKLRGGEKPGSKADQRRK